MPEKRKTEYGFVHVIRAGTIEAYPAVTGVVREWVWNEERLLKTSKIKL